MFNQGVIGWFLSYRPVVTGGEPPPAVNSAYYVTASHYGWTSAVSAAFVNNFPCQGTGRYLMVGLSYANSTPRTASVTYNGQSFSKLCEDYIYNTNGRVSLWGLENANESEASIVDVQFNGTVSEGGMFVMAFNNVATSNAVKNTTTNYSVTARTFVSSNNLTGSVSGSDMVVTCLGHTTTGTWTGSVGTVKVGNTVLTNNYTSVQYGYLIPTSNTGSIAWSGNNVRVTLFGALLRGIDN